MRSIGEAHDQMAHSLDRLSDEQLLQPAMDDWTGKDVVAHMAWWHDNSALVVEALRAGREPYDRGDPRNATDALNERTRAEHVSDSPAETRRALSESFTRLLEAVRPLSDAELFADDHWPWLGGEALLEMILWDT